MCRRPRLLRESQNRCIIREGVRADTCSEERDEGRRNMRSIQTRRDTRRALGLSSVALGLVGTLGFAGAVAVAGVPSSADTTLPTDPTPITSTVSSVTSILNPTTAATTTTTPVPQPAPKSKKPAHKPTRRSFRTSAGSAPTTPQSSTPVTLPVTATHTTHPARKPTHRQRSRIHSGAKGATTHADAAAATNLVPVALPHSGKSPLSLYLLAFSLSAVFAGLGGGLVMWLRGRSSRPAD